MSAVIEVPVEEITPQLINSTTFPAKVVVLKSEDKYACYFDNKQQVHGVCCFSTLTHAEKLSEWLDISGFEKVWVSIEEAKEIVRSRPQKIVDHLMLLDSFSNPILWHVPRND